MITRIHWIGRMWLATIALIFPMPLAEAAPASEPPPVLTDSQLISDLESRVASLAKELAAPIPQSAEDSKVTPAMVAYSMSVKAMSDIRRVLGLRKALTENTIIPTDPFHRASRDHQLAQSDCQLALVWWRHCQAQPNYRSLNLWDCLRLCAQISSKLQKTSTELAALNPEQEAVKSAGIISLAPAISDRLKNSGKGRKSVLDRVAAWDQLSNEEKSKLIVR